MNVMDETIRKWRDQAHPNCDFCYGRGFLQRIKDGKRSIDRCDCRRKKKDIVQKMNDGELVLKRGGR